MSTLVLLRHGESTWNRENLFTGWHDVPLSTKGEAEAAEAGRTMASAELWFDEVHTSLLVRAIKTANLALETLEQSWLPVLRSWRLNERHYGDLQGKNKRQTAEQYGDEQTHLWRRSYDIPPPPVAADSPEHPANDPRYRLLAPDVLPASECLEDVVARVLPYWYDDVVPRLRDGRSVLVVAHGNSLRALVMHLEGISPAAIAELNIPTGVPRRYEFAPDLTIEHAAYLGDQDAIAAAAAAVAAQSKGGQG